MAKETKVVTLQVRDVGVVPSTAGACVAKIIERGKDMRICSIELFQHQLVVRSEAENTDELGAWASSIEPVLRALVGNGARVANEPLPRSGEG